MSGASKGGLDMLTKAMGLELAPFKVIIPSELFNPDLVLDSALGVDSIQFCNRQLY